MDWAVISGVADMAAAFGVVGSLIFVGFQVRQNSAGIHNTAVQHQIAAYQDMASPVIVSGSMAENWWQGLNNPEELEGVSLLRFFAYVTQMLRTFQGMFWQRQRGVLDDGLFVSLETFLEDMVSTPGWQHVWHNRRHQFNPDFQKFVDTISAVHKGVTLYPTATAKDG